MLYLVAAIATFIVVGIAGVAFTCLNITPTPRLLSKCCREPFMKVRGRYICISCGMYSKTPVQPRPRQGVAGRPAKKGESPFCLPPIFMELKISKKTFCFLKHFIPKGYAYWRVPFHGGGYRFQNYCCEHAELYFREHEELKIMIKDVML